MNKNKTRMALISSMKRDCMLLHDLLDSLDIESDVRQALKTAILTYSWLYVNDESRRNFLNSVGYLIAPLTEEKIQRLKSKQGENL